MATVNRKITYRLYPNKEQESLLCGTLALHCRVYNTLLEEHERRYEQGLSAYTFKLMCRDLTKWRSYSSLSDLNAQSLQVTAKRVSLAFAAFFRRVKSGEEPGYPRFKPLSRFTGWGYKHLGDGWRFHAGERKNHRLRLSGIGLIPVRGKGRFAGAPKTCEIVSKGGKWYASITFDVEPDQVIRSAGVGTASFDWGLKHLLTIATQDGSIETVDNPKFLKKSLGTLKQLQLAVSREEVRAKVQRLGIPADQPLSKGTRLPITSKLKRLYRQVASLHSKVANQRHDFYHKLTTLLVSRFGAIATEEMDVKGMVKFPEVKRSEDGSFAPNGAQQKSKINRNIHDAAPAKLIQMIAYKAEDAGTWFGQAETKIVKPTQRCHVCGALVPKELKDRWHSCSCGRSCDRDANAALTLLRWLREGYFWLGTSQADEPNRLPETHTISA